ncbi:MAG: mechanosensitive ion channel [Bacteroidales bacterium]|nr:mechanosensitive ion channel [Bacteroidales bacterium]
MSFKDIINYKIVESENLTINIYNLLLASIIILAGVIIIRVIGGVFKRMIRKGRLDKGAGWSLFLVIKYIFWVILVLIVLETFGVKISIFLASIAALLIGVGLGIQQVFNDIASGIIILIERHLKVGDVIQIEDGTVGRVLSIGVRSSKIKTRDDIIMIIPNSKFVNDKVINWSLIEEKTRFHVDVGVAYGSDVEAVENILLACAGKNPEICSDPAPFVRFLSFAESSLDFQLFFWVENAFLVENIKSSLRFSINRDFKINGIHIPFPQRDLHFKSGMHSLNVQENEQNPENSV